MSSEQAFDPESYSIFVSEVRELLQCISTGVKRPHNHIDLHDLYRFVHTLKGVLAVYALDAAVVAAHKMEDHLHKLQTLREPLTKMERLRLQKSAQKVGREVVAGLRKLSAAKNRKSPRRSQSSEQLRVDAQRLIPIPSQQGPAEKLQNLKIPTLYDKVQAPPHTTMAPVLKKYLDTADMLARKLGKKIDIHFSGGEVPLPQTGMTLLFASLLHLIRNAVDHGIEPSSKRLAGGKAERGRLHLMARRHRGMFILCIADDGAGIDSRQVRNIALRRGLINKRDAARSSQDELVNLIFLPGFSLKKKVTEVSGRGIGMDAVKYAVEKHGGRILVKTEVGKGTAMKIMIPYV
ncbi:ATP-binding protein [Microbulbifer rhizosphaerae]|uniref:Chemotaxis protein CheA n=1 Tax=Microbulbifer rhizosphaerae TaxID=1562603 RepID=A0A7W4W9H8_9GAMM|nr:ATP-binding protein [Microbulbifer rhizosphaerae]MBB3060170.1 chemotaxis protein histidine kinase CheA [Microbulbifer rhizosphaerae]